MKELPQETKWRFFVKQHDGVLYRRCKSVSTRRLDKDEAVIFAADRNIEKYLNATATTIWGLLDGLHPFSAIADRLKRDFVGENDFAADVRDFVMQLADEGLVEVNANNETLSGIFPGHDASPLSLDISITRHCNLNCSFCFYGDEMRNRPDLPLEDWLQFFEELQALAVREVTLSGGEICCRSDLPAIIASLVEHNLRFSLITNGTLGNSEIVAMLSRPEIASRLNNIQVSLDGSCPEVNDLIRGPGAFASVDRFLRQIRAAGLPATSRVTINRSNLHDLEAIFTYLFDEIGIKTASCNSVCQLGCAASDPASTVLSPQERAQAMNTLRHLAENIWPDQIIATAGPLYESYQFDSMERHERLNHAYNGHLNACHCFKGKLAVHHDGVIVPCNMLGGVELGRINHDSLKAIWLGHPLLKQLASRTQVSLKSIADCQNCEYIEVCNGGCPATVISSTGDFFRPAPDNCYRIFKKMLGTQT